MLLHISANNPSPGSLVLCFANVMFIKRVKIHRYEFSAVVWQKHWFRPQSKMTVQLRVRLVCMQCPLHLCCKPALVLYALYTAHNYTDCKDCTVVCFLLGNSPASEFCMPTFRNTLSILTS